MTQSSETTLTATSRTLKATEHSAACVWECGRVCRLWRGSTGLFGCCITAAAAGSSAKLVQPTPQLYTAAGPASALLFWLFVSAVAHVTYAAELWHEGVGDVALQSR